MMMPMTMSPGSAQQSTSSGARLVATDGRVLPLLGAALRVDAKGGVARVVLEQRFRNPHAEPLAVTYSLPMPEDGAVSGFSFAIGDVIVVGEVDLKNKARERFERALSEGRSAALLEQDRASLFTQEVGNIPPGAEVVATIEVDQRLRWLDEGAWEWRFPTVVAPRYMGAPGRVPDVTKVSQDIAEGAIAARVGFSCTIRDALVQGRRPESPSHAIQSRDDVSDTGVATRIELEGEKARLDRDVVVRWTVATPKVGVSLDLSRPSQRGNRGEIAGSSFGLLTVVPPAREHRSKPVSRDVIVLLDTSGSMGGEPLAQAQRVVSAMIDTLGEHDQIELIEFSTAARRWKRGAVPATVANKKEAMTWLRALRASGSTEMHHAIMAALSSLRAESQRQVVLITDGMIGFESEVVKAIVERLPAGSRVHTVGVGSAVNRSLTGPAARAGHGVEVIIGLGEDAERAAQRIVTRTDAPLVVDLELSGDALEEHAPRSLPDLFAGSPALVSVKLRAEGGTLLVRGRTASGSWEQRVPVRAIDPGIGNAGLASLFAREKVEDLETRIAAGESVSTIDPQIERVGVEFQIATRLTSWIAVSREIMVDPRDALRRERMPHELAHGLSAEGVGLRPRNVPMPPPPPMQAGPAGAAGYGALPMSPSPFAPPPAGYAPPAPMGAPSSPTGAPPPTSYMPPPGAPAPFAAGGAPPARRAAPAPAKLSKVSAPMDEESDEYGGGATEDARRERSEPTQDERADRAPAKEAKRGGASQDAAAGRASGSKIEIKARLKKTQIGAPAAEPMSPPRVQSPSTGAFRDTDDADGTLYEAAETESPQAAREERSDEVKPDFFSRVKRFFGFGDDGTSESETSGEPSEAGARPSSAPAASLDKAVRSGEGSSEKPAKEERGKSGSKARTLEARVVGRGASDILIELLVLDLALSWAPGVSVEVTWDDGTTATLRVDESRTTRASTLEPGQSARLTLLTSASDSGRTPREILVRRGEDRLILRLA